LVGQGAISELNKLDDKGRPRTPFDILADGSTEI
jgi:hypothetical protein